MATHLYGLPFPTIWSQVYECLFVKYFYLESITSIPSFSYLLEHKDKDPFLTGVFLYLCLDIHIINTQLPFHVTPINFLFYSF